MSTAARSLVIFFVQQNDLNKETVPYKANLLILPEMADPNDYFNFDNGITTTSWSYVISDNSPLLVGTFLLGALSVSLIIVGLRYKNKLFSKTSTSSQLMSVKNKGLCIHCRNKLEEGSVYCSFCGKSQMNK